MKARITFFYETKYVSHDTLPTSYNLSVALSLGRFGISTIESFECSVTVQEVISSILCGHWLCILAFVPGSLTSVNYVIYLLTFLHPHRAAVSSIVQN